MKARTGRYIKFLPEDVNVLVSHKDCSVLEVALRAGIAIDHTCGGNATCGTCVVFVEAGLDILEPREGQELEMAEDRSFAGNERLACQIYPHPGLVVRRARS